MSRRLPKSDRNYSTVEKMQRPSCSKVKPSTVFYCSPFSLIADKRYLAF